MQKSGRNNPCPVCGRTKDADCRWSDDVIFCHQGSSQGPDQSLRIGDTININGAQWALVKTNGGYDGAASVFKPHQERSKVADTRVNRDQILTKQAERSIAALALERFFDSFHRAWDSGDLQDLTPHQLQVHFNTAYETRKLAAELAPSVQKIWRKHPDLAALHKPRFEECIRLTAAIVEEAAHFRTHYLGESPTEAWG